MAFWLKNGRLVNAYCEECPCECPCANENCPCDCHGTPIGESTQPEDKACDCVYYIVYVQVCRTPDDELNAAPENCLPRVTCNIGVGAIKCEHIYIKNTCSATDPNDKRCYPTYKPSAGSNLISNTPDGGRIYKASSEFCTREKAESWLSEHEDELACFITECCGYWGLFLARKINTGSTDPCSTPVEDCELIEAYVRNDGIIPSFTVFGKTIKCFEVGEAEEGGGEKA